MTATHRPRKRFGQHFLTDPAVIADIVDAVDARPGDTLVEIGPGRGAITIPLLATGCRLHGIEFDRDLAAALESRHRDNERFVLHQADALRADFTALGSDLRLVGNLPYNISTPLLFHLLQQLDSIADMHFMLQKEVVDRMAAAPGSKRYGRLTVMLGCRVRVESLFDVPPSAFTPPPRVSSSVVRLDPLGADGYRITDSGLLGRLVAKAFSQRRKTLHNALGGDVGDEQLEEAGIDPRLRAEAVPVADWVRLANSLAARP